MANLAKRRKLREKAQQTTKKAALGTGARFKAVSKSIEAGLKSHQLRPGQTKAQAAAAIAAMDLPRTNLLSRAFRYMTAAFSLI